ncbi:MAG TPA: prolyl oligopeptidase family serine peptidase [Ignavibacteria bacterium]|nr:prolyl oligopeptidase family serine peptidase [Ignavibacteria bacterium]
MTFEEEEITLTGSQEKFIVSGWGIKVLNDTIVKKISYTSDGHKVNGYFAHPVNTGIKYPLIIWNRGGSKRDGMIDKFLARGIFGEMASWGFVVLASQYRKEDEFGGKDINDILNLFPIAENISFCDTGKIGMEGWSRGGMMTYRVLSLTDKVKCAVIISGLADLFRSEKNNDDLAGIYFKLFGTEDEGEYINRKKIRSAVHFADKINKDTKLLLIHGTADDKVSHEDSEDMYELLKKSGVECELKLIDNGDHYLKSHREEVAKLRKKWFDRNLKV